MADLQSAKNQRVSEWKKLQTKKGRDKSGTYLIEGMHLIEEALKTEDIMEYIIQEDLTLPDSILSSGGPVTTITSEISKAISSTETPQGIFAVCRKRQNRIALSRHKRILMLDGVQDPGNVGTMIRTADAAGMDAVILGEGTADLYNPKVIRSAQGSHFHLEVEPGSLPEWIVQCKDASIPVYGTALEKASPYKELEAPDAFALIVGNEGAGVAPAILEMTDRNLYIPIYGQCESLNVGIAAGILMYHLRK
ncbi:MAG TPA: RNA methyltransferase [Bacillaceae bacterium]